MIESPEHWKDKYLHSLKELEEREKLWRESEDLLRGAVGRLAHSGYGQHASLDRQLDTLRAAVKARKEAESLDLLVREAIETAIGVQDQNQQDAAAFGRALVPLLRALQFDRARKGQVRRLCKRLKAVDRGEPLQALLTETTELLNTLFEPPEQPSSLAGGSGSDRRPGLLERLFGGGKTHVELTAAAPQPSPPKEQGLTHALRTLLTQIDTRAPGAERFNELQARAARCHDQAGAQALLAEAATVISELLATTLASTQPALSAQDPLPGAGAILLDLMTRIEIPHALQPRLADVKTEILQAETAEQVRFAVQAIADLMSDIRRQVQNEKHDLETFLEGVTNRIQVLSENVVDLHDNRQASTRSRQALQQSFRTHMQGIRTRMADSEDVEALKHAIQDGLDAIELQLTNHVQREEQLTRDAEQRIADLNERLYDMKNEASLLQREIQEQRDLAMRDPLTGVSSRLAMEEHIDREFSRWKRYGNPLALCIVDIDHFKRINDSFGHLAGDKVLKALAERVRSNVREVDIVCRYGGEEFVVIMPNTGLDAAYQVAEKLRGMVAASGFRYGEEPVHVTVSCGVAAFRKGDDAQGVFKRADAALYEAKHSGRNRTQLEQDPAADAIRRSIA